MELPLISGHHICMILSSHCHIIQLTDLTATVNGGVSLGYSDPRYRHPTGIVHPGGVVNMGDGCKAAGQQDSRTARKHDSKTTGQQDSTTAGQQASKTAGQQDSRTARQQDSRTARQHDSRTGSAH
jgi:hypothetical protein